MFNLKTDPTENHNLVRDSNSQQNSIILSNFQIKSNSSHRNIVRKMKKRIMKLYRTEMVDGTVDYVRLDKLGIDLEDPDLTTGWCRPVT